MKQRGAGGKMHVDPEVVPFMLGGSLFMHNPPIPMEI